MFCAHSSLTVTILEACVRQVELFAVTLESKTESFASTPSEIILTINLGHEPLHLRYITS
jgi:hypothetical protein